PSQQGRAGLRLQHALPNARVLYVSATGATTVHNLASALRLGLWDSAHFPFAARADFARAWQSEVVTVPEFTDSSPHIGIGLRLPVWKRLPNDSTRVYRLQTRDGERIIGRPVSPAGVARVVEGEGPALDSADVFTAVLDGRTMLQLRDELELGRIKVMGDFRNEVSRITDGMIDRLKARGLVCEVIAWKLRLFLPIGRGGLPILGALMERYLLVPIVGQPAA